MHTHTCLQMLLASAVAILVAGVLSTLVPGGAAVRTSLAEMQSNLPADLASRLIQVLDYVPLALTVIGAVLVAIACTGCCSSFSSGRFLLHIYVGSMVALVCAEGAIIAYGVVEDAHVENAAAQLVGDLWDRECVCMVTNSQKVLYYREFMQQIY
jgi:hypothetical protein